MIKIPFHSATDLITNSSTVIFTYSENSEAALKEMINELFETFGIDKKCEDVFDTIVLADEYQYTETALEADLLPEGITSEDAERIYEEVLSGKIPKPDWFKKIEEQESSWNYFLPSTYLHLIPKKPEYEKLASLVHKFLYSTNHEGTYDG